jgi:hypothetical protein
MARSQMLPYGRSDRRMPANLPVNITCAARQVLAEAAYTENISASGARIVTRRIWPTDERLQLECVRWDFRSTARVAYCEPLPGDKFAVGLQFLNPPAPPARSPDDSPWPPLSRKDLG